MFGKRRPAMLVVLATAMLLSASTAGVAFAESPSTADVQSTEDQDVVDSFVERISTLESVEFDRTITSTYDNETTTVNSSIAIDFEDGQKRLEMPDQNATTVINESKSVTYNADKNTVSDYERATTQSVPFNLRQLTNESMVSYEHVGTETIDGQSTYVLEGTPEIETDQETNASLTLYVDTETYFPVQMTSTTSTENYDYSSTRTYRNVSVNEEIPDSTFELEVPDDATDPSEEYSIESERFDDRDALASSTDLAMPDTELGDGFSFEHGTVIYGDDHDRGHLTYTDGDRTVSVTVYDSSLGATGYGDSDRSEEVSIGDTTGYLYSSDEYEFTSLQWDSGQSYGVYGSVTEETVTDIAESIEN